MGTFAMGILFGGRWVSTSYTQKEKGKNHQFFHKILLRWSFKGIK